MSGEDGRVSGESCQGRSRHTERAVAARRGREPAAHHPVTPASREGRPPQRPSPAKVHWLCSLRIFSTKTRPLSSARLTRADPA